MNCAATCWVGEATSASAKRRRCCGTSTAGFTAESEVYAWKQWKTGKRRFEELRRLGIGKDLAARTAGSRKRYWHISRSPALNMRLTRAFLIGAGSSPAPGT